MSETSKKKVIVVIPVYLDKLPYDDEMCVKRYLEILSDEDIVFIAPEKINQSWYKETFGNIKFVLFEDKFFTGTKGYNHLLLDTKFYKTFLDYEYMLIAQTDACIWSNKNELQRFILADYDYYGAPWIPERRIWEWIWERKNGRLHFRLCKKKGQGLVMGNGGFCLRRISQCIRLIDEYRWRKCYWFIKRNEDIFFGLFGMSSKCNYKLADVETGKEFALEYNLKDSVKSGNIPFGVHGWKKEFSGYDEMKKFLEENGVWQQNQ